MSRVETSVPLQVPDTLEAQLRDFRRRVWTAKMTEACAVALASLLAAYLLVYAMDRVWDTPGWVRAAALLGVLAGAATIPVYWRRWVWRRRRLEQLARLLSHKMPRVGDQLLGVIELAHSEAEQTRSRRLCQAAIEHVAADVQNRDLRAAAPTTHRFAWLAAAGGAGAIALALAAFVPASAGNAWARLLSPWGGAPRYTFAGVAPLPSEIVVAHGEPFSLVARLSDGSQWRPETATVRFGAQDKTPAQLIGGQYTFKGPALLQPTRARVTVGDWYGNVRVTPKLRPELASLSAEVTLPEYLGQPEPAMRDVRGGGVSLVEGSRVQFTAAANRPLAEGLVDGRVAQTEGEKLVTDAYEVSAPREVILEWKDRDGLTGKEPFTISIEPREDEPPTVTCEDLPRRRVVLDSEQLAFRVAARDDFGVQRVGMEWKGVGGELVERVAGGEQMLAPGGHDQAVVEAQGVFRAQSLGIEPQPIELRLFVTDYYPDRERVYSPPYLLYVLDANQHAIWMTEQLARWQRRALEVRDRELSLYEENKRIRALSTAELDQAHTRRAVEDQAAAERANARRLTGLSRAGEELLREAARNPEIGVGHLDRWAEMLQVLKDIAANRMPSVADLLKDASQADAARTALAASRPSAGQSRAAAPGTPAETPKDAKTPPAAPGLTDIESSDQPADPDAKFAESQKKNPSAPSLRLPETTLMGQAKPGAKSPAGQKVDQAVVEQKDLLAEFEKVANELNELMANLEGSTLVKRLKAASREQYRIAGRLADQIERGFGGELIAEPEHTVEELSGRVDSSSVTVSYIMDDMEAYFERRRMVRFKTILDEMRSENVVGALRRLSSDMEDEQGLSIAQCEFWSDAMDRWAEDLVDPACSGQCPGSRSKGSLPPSIVLAVLKILEGEINLRDETRVAEQAREAIVSEKHEGEADRLAAAQSELDERTVDVVRRIRELPDAEAEFAKELALLTQVSTVMQETAGILARPETGDPAIAAETEVIELLLRSRRINPNGGGGGGDSPGGGGGGDTQDTALALLGAGLNQKETPAAREPEQAVGVSGASLPMEFRAGLDQYFSELERAPEGG